jgi:NitT/TauT family transport system substrate-binding protein
MMLSFVLMIVVLFLAAPGWAQSSLVPVLVSYSGLSGFQLPLWVLKERGLDRKYGLAVEVVLVRGGVQNVQALLGGSTQFAQVAGDVTVGAALKGANIVTIAASLNQYVHSLVSRPGVASAADLKGKKIGIARFGGMTQWVARLELEAIGLDSREIVFLQAGNVQERLMAMEKGVIDATVFSYPELVRVKKMGYRVLVEPRSLKAYFPTSTIAVKRDYLQKNRQVAKNFLRGYSEANRIVRSNKEVGKKVLVKYTGISDPETLDQSYDFAARLTEVIPWPSLRGIESVLKELAEREDQRRYRAEDFVDTSLLEELEREGFFKGLAR